MAIQDAEPPAGAPDWIVTFADMISLLVTFFILLMTFSSLESYDVFKVEGNITGTTGTLSSDGSDSSIPPPKVDIMAAKDAQRGAQIPHSRPSEELLEQVNETGIKASDKDVELDLAALSDGMLIQFDERAAFKPGSAELTEELRRSVEDTAGVLEHYGYTLIFEGHTDNAFKPAGRYGTETALSIARAQAAAEAALGASSLHPMQIQVAGYGANRPLDSNETAEGRRRNRRVEVRVMSMSKSRAAALKRKELTNG